MSAVMALTGCYIPHPRFGAHNFRQEKDRNGLPTYNASGSLPEYEKVEPVVAKVIAEACPDGNPVIVDGQKVFTKGTNGDGMPFSDWWWTVTFTCEKAIAGLTPPSD